MSDLSVPIEAPGGFAPVQALGYDDGSGMVTLVGSTMPLPTMPVLPAPAVPLTGEAAIAALAGPFEPVPLAPVYLTLSGDWRGRVTVLRSVDGGSTRHRLTAGGAGWGSFVANGCEAVWVETVAGAQLWLDLVPQSGTITYQVSQ